MGKDFITWRVSLAAVALAATMPAWPQAINSAQVTTGSGVATVAKPGAGTHGNPAIVNWQTFSIGVNEPVKFVQPGVSSTALIRPIGADSSAIIGTLAANRATFLAAPRVILHHPASFTAAAMRLTDQQFLANHQFSPPASGKGKLAEGAIHGRSGDVTLVPARTSDALPSATRASNGGVLLAPSGTAVIVARSLEGIHLEVRNAGNVPMNLGTLQGDPVTLFASMLRHPKFVRADAASVQGGRVSLHAANPIVLAAAAGPGQEVRRSGAPDSAH